MMSNMKEAQESPFVRELTELLNRHSMENGSDTPDFILADYLMVCLVAFNAAVARRAKWYAAPAEEATRDD